MRPPKAKHTTQSGSISHDLRRDLTRLCYIPARAINDLFDGELSDDDRLVYVNHVKGKLLESDILVQQASNNSKGQFDNSPDLDSALTDAIIDTFDAYTSMSKQALDSERVRSGLKAILLGPAQLYEALRERAIARPEAGLTKLTR